jgi:hypothetical protein
VDELQKQPGPSKEPECDNNSLKLLPHQIELLSALNKVNPELGNRYLGALMVLNQIDNPDWLAQSAHSIRELMNGLTIYLDIGIQTPHKDVVDRVRGLADKWGICITKTQCQNDSRWEGEIDKPLSKYLTDIQNFFHWFKELFPSSTVKLAKVFHKLEPSEYNLPEPIQKMNVEKWNNAKDFFIQVLHHQTSTLVVEEFNQRLNELERILLDMLKPKTITDLKEIDKIIQDAEGND